MTFQDLCNQMDYHFRSPQKSERWVMYRIINPIVDFSCRSKPERIVFFEYNQPSSVGTVQSADIAVLEDNIPVILIEAKKADKEISPDLIAKYLSGTVFGIVSNGYWWIVVSSGGQTRHLYLNLWKNKRISEESLLDLIKILECSDPSEVQRISSGWDETIRYIKPEVRPARSAAPRATRQLPSKKIMRSPIDVICYCRTLTLGKSIRSFIPTT